MTEQRRHNSTLAIGGVPSPLDSFVVAESSVLRTNPDSNRDAEKPAQRQSAKRYASPYDNNTDKNNRTNIKNNKMPTLRKIKRGASQRTKPTLLHHI